MKQPILQQSNSSPSGIQRSAVTRRTFLATAGTASLASVFAAPGHAATNHTFRHGAFDISVLSDGHLVVPARLLATTTDRKDLDPALAAAGQRSEWVPAPSNVTLVRTSSDVILIDTGAGPHFMPTAG